MKKALSLLLVLVMYLSLCACSGGKGNDIGASNVQENEIKEQITAVLKEKEQVFRGNDVAAFANYIVSVRSIIESDDSLSVVEFFPYDLMKNFIENNCALVLCEDGAGGFYDEHPYGAGDNYWYDPLEEKTYTTGDVGRYHSRLEPFYYGDLLVFEDEKTWYGTDADDPNNYLKAELYYQDKKVSKNYLEMQEFLEYTNSDNTYCAKNGDDNCTLFVLQEGYILILQDKLFMIKYE